MPPCQPSLLSTSKKNMAPYMPTCPWRRTRPGMEQHREPGGGQGQQSWPNENSKTWCIKWIRPGRSHPSKEPRRQKRILNDKMVCMYLRGGKENRLKEMPDLLLLPRVRYSWTNTCSRSSLNGHLSPHLLPLGKMSTAPRDYCACTRKYYRAGSVG